MGEAVGVVEEEEGEVELGAAAPSSARTPLFRAAPTELDPKDLKLGALVGQGAFGRVYRGTWLEPISRGSAFSGASFVVACKQ